MNVKLVKRTFFILGLLALIAMAGIFWAINWMQTSVVIADTQQTFEINRGESTAGVANRLAQAGRVDWPFVWRAYAHWVESKPIQAGEYKFPPHTTPLGLLHQFQRGDVVKYTVTFPEGKTYREFLEILKQQPKIRHELANKPLGEHKKLLKFNYENLEGWFFPDTYEYLSGDSDKEILLLAHKKMQQTLERVWRTRADNLPYASASEALTMASLIEKETGQASERSKIAGVFVRRLNNKMRLQTDPAVIYGLGNAYSGNLTLKDLQAPGPYNTYLIDGLPPGPIANPGLEALQAALHPAEGDELYFVGKGDGSHIFSAKLTDHNKAVEQYQRVNRAENYRSSPKGENSK